MIDLPSEWRGYARAQAALSHRHRLDSRALGLEEALNRILDSALEVRDEEIEAISASAARKERHRHAIRRRLIFEQPSDTATCDAADAAQTIERVRKSISSREWRVLVSLAAGVTYQQMQTTTGRSGNVRVQICRLRAKLKVAA
jgi:hypothetical protein